MKDYKKAIENIMADTTNKVINHAISAYNKGYADGFGKAQTDSYVKGYEDGQKEKPQAIYEMKVEEYNKGLNEAWEVARKIEHPKGYFCNIKEVFGEESAFSVLLNMTASEAIQKIKDYEEKQTEKSCKTCNNFTKEFGCDGDYEFLCECIDNSYKHWTPKQTEDEIKVGYEVYNLDPENKRIVTAIDGDKAIQLCSNGKYTVDNIDTLHWTGREDLRIKKVLEKITNEV